MHLSHLSHATNATPHTLHATNAMSHLLHAMYATNARNTRKIVIVRLFNFLKTLFNIKEAGLKILPEVFLHNNCERIYFILVFCLSDI